MDTKEVSSWEEFVAAIEEIKLQYGTYKFLENQVKNVVLYRGQPDASLHLDTTLERYSPQTWTMRSYSKMTLGCAPTIECYTETDWSLPSSVSEFNKQLAETQGIFLNRVPFYSYWIYLRHHGFPSPLLDWTHSPYIAAYFALAEKYDVESAAVFAFWSKCSHPPTTFSTTMRLHSLHQIGREQGWPQLHQPRDHIRQGNHTPRHPYQDHDSKIRAPCCVATPPGDEHHRVQPLSNPGGSDEGTRS